MTRDDLRVKAQKLRERADVIDAWIKGKKVQIFDDQTGCWEDLTLCSPSFDEGTLYRVKPEPREITLYDHGGCFKFCPMINASVGSPVKFREVV